MSTATARQRAAVEAPRTAERQQPALRVVPRAAATVAGRLPFAFLVGSLLAGGLIALLILHTQAAQDAFRLHDLQRQAAALDDTEQQLQVATQEEQAPASLAARARRLGMVPTGSISFVRLHSGRVVRVVHAAPAPAPTPAATTSAAPTPTATAGPTTGASSGPAATKPAGCSHAHCRTSARSR